MVQNERSRGVPAKDMTHYEFALPAPGSAGALALKTFYVLMDVREGMQVLGETRL